MSDRLLAQISQYVSDNISKFHTARLDSLNKLNLKKVLSRKNPYLFKAKYQESAADIVKTILNAHLSSSEETIFGDWLEGLAIFISETVYGGVKSSATGIDLEFDKDGVRYIVSIKSGPNWGNSSQVKKLENDFKQAMKILHTSRHEVRIEAINGCCYGSVFSDKGFYKKICGQKFWELISGRENLYIEIIQPLGTDAKKRTEEFEKKYGAKLNLLLKDFIRDYCRADGSIDWEKIVKLNAGAKQLRLFHG